MQMLLGFNLSFSGPRISVGRFVLKLFVELRLFTDQLVRIQSVTLGHRIGKMISQCSVQVLIHSGE